MPLSEDEQRILHEMEQTLYEHDPAFADRVRSKTVYRHAGRYCKWAALGFVGGLVLLVLSFSTSLVAGFMGFLVMLGSAVVFERNFRRVGRAGWADLTRSARARGIAEAMGDTRRRLRERFKRPD